MNVKKLLILLLFFSLLFSDDSISSDKYLFSDVGLGYSHIKDTGTSPLRYHGLYSGMKAGLYTSNLRNIFNVEGYFSYTLASASSYYILNYFIGEISFSYLHTLPVIKNDNLRWRVGGTFDASVSGALNPDFQNASLNVDFLADLMISSIFEYDFKLSEKRKHFLFFHYDLPERNYRAFFSMDLPLIIMNGRPEFPYLNEEDLDYLTRHYYIGGFTMRTELGLKRYLKNGNMIEIAYRWQMLTSGKRDIHLLERATHELTTAFYFKLN